jgi:predicted Zn-dependent protease
VIALVHEHARVQRSLDLVGFYAGGPVVRAFADSLGSRHWHRIESFHFDWCLYRRGDKAVKTRLAGTHWDDAEFVARLDEAARRAPLLDRSPLRLAPGAYRAAFAPDAMVELVSMLGWGGFSLKQRRTGVSPLVRLERGDAFAAGFDLDEATGAGIAPAFTAEGFVRPERVALVERGRLPDSGGTLNSPRSALEYGVPANGAQASEAPESLRLAPGTLAAGELLRALDTGLYVGHLWYLNFSDRQACRMTGMTRFACLWVERGTPVAPVEVMRFDDDALRLFGPGLEALASESEFVPNGDTIGARTPGSVTVPATLVEGFRLTL